MSAAKETKDVRHISVLFTSTVKLPNLDFSISKTTKPISNKFIYFLPYIYQRGFSNWKDVTASFTQHKQSKSYKEAMHAIVTVSSCYKGCTEMLSSQHAKEKADNRHVLYEILSNVWFLA